ncbi:MAG: polyhydroxyalkanoate synthesis repressor PhaR [Caulobacterales bacterium]|nr:polyhydroxyalkanoate synthesis repressor PhaR [Caulobacterales bacterium]
MTEKTKARIEKAAENGAIVVKKYANRRLYNTATSSYVTLEELSTMVKEGIDFIVYDAKSGEDITRSVLTQIIFEQESRGQNLLPIQFLRRLIRFYGDSLQVFVPSYLEASMEAFARQQGQMRERFGDAWAPSRAMDAFEEQARQNMAFFQQAMRMFAPFPADRENGEEGGAPAAAASTEDKATIDDLRRQMAELHQRLDHLARKSETGDT